jgi:hypothetical protein
MLQHPFLSIPAAAQWALLLALIVPFVLVGQRADGGLRSGGLGNIAQLELAASKQRANTLLERWSGPGVLAGVRAGVHWDYLLIVIYSCGAALMCSLASKVTPGGWASLGNWLAWAAWLAGVCDALENVGLLVMLNQYSASHTVAQPTPLATAFFAAIKFALILASVLYGLSGPVRCALAARG